MYSACTSRRINLPVLGHKEVRGEQQNSGVLLSCTQSSVPEAEQDRCCVEWKHFAPFLSAVVSIASVLLSCLLCVPILETALRRSCRWTNVPLWVKQCFGLDKPLGTQGRISTQTLENSSFFSFLFLFPSDKTVMH